MMFLLEKDGGWTASLVQARSGGHPGPVWVGYMPAVYEPGRRWRKQDYAACGHMS
jgi:hypothetical protein